MKSLFGYGHWNQDNRIDLSISFTRALTKEKTFIPNKAGTNNLRKKTLYPFFHLLIQ